MKSWHLAGGLAALLAAAILATRTDIVPGSADTWHALRASGFVAYSLLWLSCVTGMAHSLHPSIPGVRPTHLFELHRISALLAGSFLVGHLVGVLVDPWIPFHPLDIVVGFTAPYRPAALFLGAVATWAVAVVLGTTAWGGALTYPQWLKLHRLAFPGYIFALLHALLAGTDRANPTVLALTGITAGCVAGLAVLRLGERTETPTASAAADPGR